jgi:predicted TIM-barrel fold metal-dependent hydrolase
VGHDRLLLGTDYPFPVDDRAPLQLLQETGWSEEDIARIAGDNARQLFHC